MDIGQISFRFVCEIEPKMDSNGNVCQFLPQKRYINKNQLKLNKYGEGPFCKFKIPTDWTECGVYALVVDSAVKYVGECINLSSRYNMGYGNISPRNCFIGGQETNCRINNLIFSEVQKHSKITLWFYSTTEYKAVEERLRIELQLDWNRI